MKNLNKILAALVVFLTVNACTDYQQLDYSVSVPESIELLNVLNQYDNLKSYVNQSTDPNFKLGAGVVFSDYTSKGVMYRLANSNFDEIADGYTMKHGAVVQDDGSLNLANVNLLLQTAKDAGVSIYGHCLVWSSNQNASYLNSLIAPTITSGGGGGGGEPTWDVVSSQDFETDDDSNYSHSDNDNTILSFTAAGGGSDGVGRALQITNTEVQANDWNCQLFFNIPEATQEGDQYELNMDIRSDVPATYSTQAQSSPGNYVYWDFFGSPSSTTEWTNYDKTITVSSSTAGCKTIAFNLGLTATTYYFDNITVKKYNTTGGGSSSKGSIMINDFESDALGTTYPMTGNSTATVVEDPAGSGSKVLSVGNAATPANQSEPIFNIKLPEGITLGNCKNLILDIYVVDNQGIYGQGLRMIINGKEGNVGDNFAVLGAKNNDWGRNLIVPISMVPLSEADKTLTEFTLSFGNKTGAGFYYYDNIRMDWEKSGDLSTEKTPEEKATIIDNAMATWIGGMVANCKDYVKAWDVVNEPMSDWPDPAQLKTGVDQTGLADDVFFWQDYMGKDYAARAIQLERKYGNPDDKLFINDYNLESNPDKCKGLIDFVKYTDGVCNSMGVKGVDGIGTQMHVSITADTAKIVQMFQLLAATGKLIKISELDMGLGSVMTANATDSMYIAQANLYEFIVKKYFEIIPAAQRYGITQWALTDSPANSSWRAGEPIGLWTLDLYRKRAYGGFANGLAGKDVSKEFN